MAVSRLSANSGCDKSVRRRARRGDTERYYRDVVLAYEGDECLPWPYAVSNGGYGLVTIDGQVHRVTRLACQHVHGPAPTPEHQAAHSCGNAHMRCCTKRHLSWKTRTENEADKLLHGTDNRGERSGLAKLTDADIPGIRQMAATGMTYRQIGAQFGVHKDTIARVIQRRGWDWV